MKLCTTSEYLNTDTSFEKNKKQKESHYQNETLRN